MRSGRFLDSGSLRRSRDPIEVMMTPMIDVIFLLLVFFLATSTFRVVEKLMPSGVSEVASATGDVDQIIEEIPLEFIDQVIVKIVDEADGTKILVNGIALRKQEELKGRFFAISQVQVSTPVIIDPEPTVPAATVVRVYDWARSSGLSRVYLATRAR
jgi:biopolymer transport protein ExbD